MGYKNNISILGKEFPVLDKGFVRLVDVMGDDSAIVQAARVSYGAGTKTHREDRELIRYLMRHRHTTPFEQCELKFHVKVPMDTWRQWVRHRTASINEYSTRYSEVIEDKQTTKPTEWRLQSKINKQGSDNFLESKNIGEILSYAEKKFHEEADKLYKFRLKHGIAREQARKDCPISTYTTAYWKINLHNLLHFLSLRMDSHAQLEIRSFANVIGYDIVAKLFPLTWEAFCDYRLNSITLSAHDIALLSHILKGKSLNEVKDENWFGWFGRRDDGTLKNNNERLEFEKKVKLLGIDISWS